MDLPLALLVPLFLEAYYQFILQMPKAIHNPIRPHIVFHDPLLPAFTDSLAFFRPRKRTGNFYRRESLAMVVIIWVLTPVIWAFLFTSATHSPIPLQPISRRRRD